MMGIVFTSSEVKDYTSVVNLRRRRELETTLIELKAIAPAAKIGFMVIPKDCNTPAATGMRAELYPKAQKRFCLIFE
jgi:hypothetical protein